MRLRISALVSAALLLSSAGALAQANPRAMAAPKVTFTQFHSFHLLPPALRRTTARTGGAYDPMQHGSAANRMLRRIVSDEFADRGYFDSEWLPDFLVAIYASSRDSLDLSMWEYDYAYSPSWWPGGSGVNLTSYAPGTVVVDVVNPETLDVLWRGTATASIGTNELANTNALLQAAIAIVDQFPRAKPIVVAAPARAPR